MSVTNQSTEKIACHCCDLVLEIPELLPRQKAHCPRCGHLISTGISNAYNRASAYALTSLVFLLLSLPFPFLSFKSQGREQETSLLQSGFDLIVQGFPILALLLCLFILLIPALILCGYLSILLPLRTGYCFFWMYSMARALFILHPWGMAEVFLIGVLVSLVKISGMADLVIGLSFWSYVLFALFLILTITSVDRLQLWHTMDKAHHICRLQPKTEPKGALLQNLHCCHHCSLLTSVNQPYCARCGTKLHARIPFSLQKTWAYLLTSIMLYFPANLYPIMHTTLLGSDEPSTILGGVLTLWQHGSYPIAAVVFIASVLIPVAKMLVLSWLVISVQASHEHRVEERVWMYRITELIGRWSMIDVFVVAVLVALVQPGGLVSVQPGIATIAFAGVVILTMLSALSFDPRLIWDNLRPNERAAINQGQESLNDLLD
ncbi:paraquat-inducible protein A [Oceanospirillum beijerinckii]|uniref:paraquat-inducible protein A n=1 Tax=Oceanospirillum beijerinckii TaxID=64976 RepID=UPI000415DB55|nr:paraquat-inducible protein A [Oceanospirillum beijerinckii]